jgi:hypothetical protein
MEAQEMSAPIAPTRPFADIFCTWDVELPMSRIAITGTRASPPYGVVPVYPAQKKPMCILTARERNLAGPDHPCGASHAITNDVVAKRVFERLERDYLELNIGIVARASLLVVVDADTPGAVNAFRERWALEENDNRYLEFGPTVSTPGARNAAGEWKHEHGGHWYFYYPPELEPLPLHCDNFIGPGGYDVRWGNLLTVAPPSRRPEGLYVANGDCLPTPRFLINAVRDFGIKRAERHARWAERYVNDPIARWASTVTSLELLTRHGWRYTEHLDRRCGCPVFEKPGGGSTGERSAIGHDDDCQIYENYEGHGPLHLWTTDPPEPLAAWVRDTGSSTLTKLQYAAVMEYAGDVDAAKIGLGIEPDFGRLWEAVGDIPPNANDPEPKDKESAAQSPEADEEAFDQAEQREEASAKGPEGPHPLSVMAEALAKRIGVPLTAARQEVGREWLRREARAIVARFLDADLEQDGSTWAPRQADLTAVYAEDLADVVSDGVLARSDDGARLFPPGYLHVLFGQSESGKTWIASEAIRQVCRAGGRAFYIDFEDTIRAFVRRLRDDLHVTELGEWIAEGRLAYANPSEPSPPTSRRPSSTVSSTSSSSTPSPR